MKKNVFLFPGQGSQYIGMGQELYNKFKIARETFEEANDILEKDIQKICFEGGLAKLSQIDTLLEAVFVANVVGFRCYMEEIGLPPYAMIGHSLGEYSALACSGAISFGDALKIVKERALLGKRAVSENLGYMAIVENLDYDIVEQICEQYQTGTDMVGVTCYNSFYQTAIGGKTESMEKVEKELAKAGARITPLLFSPPFHSPVMKDYLDEFKQIICQYEVKEPECIVIANATAKPYTKDTVKENLIAQIIMPVMWTQSIQYVWNQGAAFGIDLGAKGILSDLISETVKGLSVFSYNSVESKKELISFCNATQNWAESDTAAQCLKACITTKASYDGKKEQVRARELYQEMLQVCGNDQTFHKGQEKAAMLAIENLKEILMLKNVPKDIQDKLLVPILEGIRHGGVV